MPPTPAAADAHTAIVPRDFIVWSAVAHAAFFVLRFTYMWLDDLVRGESGTFLARLIEEGSGSLGSFLLSGLAYLAWRAAPLRAPHLWTRLPGYLGLGLLMSAANTSFMWGTRTLAFPLLGLGAYDYGKMPLRYLMEAPGALIGFASMIAVLALADANLRRRHQETTRLELERALAESQLRALRLQLQPHFLFNALNTISAQLHDDPAAADRLIGRLSDLLRASLRTTDGSAVPLRDELALLDAYAELMRARFGARLSITVDAPHELADALVPPVLLQPLVENAVRHGGLERDGTARVTVTARRSAAQLTLRVHDDGPGITNGRDPLTAGTGLSTTARRLALLHGDAAHLDAANAAEGGFAVTVTLPAP